MAAEMIEDILGGHGTPDRHVPLSARLTVRPLTREALLATAKELEKTFQPRLAGAHEGEWCIDSRVPGVQFGRVNRGSSPIEKGRRVFCQCARMITPPSIPPQGGNRTARGRGNRTPWGRRNRTPWGRGNLTAWCRWFKRIIPGGRVRLVRGRGWLIIRLRGEIRVGPLGHTRTCTGIRSLPPPEDLEQLHPRLPGPDTLRAASRDQRQDRQAELGQARRLGQPCPLERRFVRQLLPDRLTLENPDGFLGIIPGEQPLFQPLEQQRIVKGTALQSVLGSLHGHGFLLTTR